MPKKRKAPDFLADTEPNVVEVTQSFFRKLNLAIHGGAQYETLDLGLTLKATVSPGDDKDAVCKSLYEEAKKLVEEEIALFDKEMEKREAQKDPTEKKTAKKLGIDKEELEGISDLINELISADTKEALTELGEKIKERQDLNDSQLNYLRTKYNLKLKEIKNVSE